MDGPDLHIVEKEMPELKIPGTPEVIMKGVISQFMPVVMRCSLGGWIVIIPNKGIAAFSDLEAAGCFLIDQAYTEMGEEKPKMPRFMDHDGAEGPREPLSIGKMARATLQSLVGVLILALGVKIL